MGGVGSIGMVVFGILWTVLVFEGTKDTQFPGIGIIFPLFGVVFVVLGIARAAYNFKNATSRDRFSLVDITEPGEESDPFDAMVGIKPRREESVEDKLTELKELRAKGLISDSEYSAQRQRILNQI